MAHPIAGQVDVYQEAEWSLLNFSKLSLKNVSQGYKSKTFHFKEYAFHLEIVGENQRKAYSVFLHQLATDTFTVVLTLYIKQANGDLYGGKEAMNIHHDFCYLDFLPIELLNKHKEDFLPNDTLTLVIRMEDKNSNRRKKKNEKKYSKLETLSENFKDLYNNKESCDLILKVKKKEFKAHRSVLIARCCVFAATFKHDTIENQTGVITISDCDPDSFDTFLHYLYCGKIEALCYQKALNLYHTSDKYGVVELKSFCIDFLKDSLTLDNIYEVVIFADKYSDSELLYAVQKLFKKHVVNILETPEWENFTKTHYHLANRLLKKMQKVKLS